MSFNWTVDPTKWIDKKATDWQQQVGEILVKDIRTRIARRYPPSGAPGKYPAYRSGDLQSSIFTAPEGKTFQIVGASVPYAMHLELGHYGGGWHTGWVQGRPYMQLAVLFRRKNKIRLK